MRNPMIIAACLILSWTSCAFASGPCGDVAIEGYCDGGTRVYCNGADVVTEICAACCGWTGQKYNCLELCPAPGECVDECNDTGLFGCSLENTHEWTCSEGENGCTVRTFIACEADEICDESSTHKCVIQGSVDVCGVIPTHGICHGTVFKQCVNGQVVQTNCELLGQQCGPAGCNDCIDVCEEGSAKCVSGNKAQSCVDLNGCLQWSGAKNCGIKACVEGQCVEVVPDTGSDDLGTGEVIEPPPAPEPAPKASSGGCIMGLSPDGMVEASLILLATLLGLILFRNMTDGRS